MSSKSTLKQHWIPDEAEQDGGVVARIPIRAIPEVSAKEPIVEEILAITMALIKAREEGWRKIVIESDCKTVVDKILNGALADVSLGTVLEDIFCLQNAFQECFVFPLFIGKATV